MTSPRPRPGVLAIEAYVPGKSGAAGEAPPIKLSSNEAALGPSPLAIAAYHEAGKSLHRYPEGDSATLRQAIGKRFGLDPARIVCGTGSDDLIANLARAYAGPGDEVLYSRHGFTLYPICALAAGATPVMAPERDYTTDIDALVARAGPRTKLCFLANPNNPTGTMITTEIVRRLRAGLPSHVLLVLDAAYAEFVTRNDYSPGIELVDAGDNVVMLRTFSKLFALAGLRVGWAYCPPAVADVLNRVRGAFNVPSAGQAAAVAALGDVAFADAQRAHNDVWRPWLEREIRAVGLAVVPSVANFVLVEFPADAKRGAAAANAFLAKRRIIVRSLEPYKMANHLRITVGTGPEMRAVVDALRDFLAGVA
jgi:histidinol-phosphate aminotransferase